MSFGVWAAEEYDRLLTYDRPTQLQPTAVFLCHQGRSGRRSTSGKTFEMRGRVESDGKLVFNFSLYCTVA